MSVLSKMMSTDKYLSQIYRGIKNEIKEQSNLTAELASARRLQALLTQIKFLQKQYQSSGSVEVGDSFPFASFWKKSEQIAMMQALYNINPSIFTEGTFIDTFSGMDNQAYMLGNSLEVGVARVIYGIGAKVSGQTYEGAKNVLKSKVGGLHTQVPDLVADTNEEMKNIFSYYYQEVGKALREYKGGTQMGGVATTMSSVQGKIDNVGFTADFTAGVTVTGMDQDIVSALRNATFTDKNYLTTSELHFGQTNPFRVFATVAPEGIDTVGRYSRMLECFEKHMSSHSDAPITFYRIRAIYELTGAKMKYTDKSLENNSIIRELLEGQIAKFLIWNTPYGDIRVIPTRQIVNKIIDSASMAMPNNWRDALYGPVSLSQNALAQLLD